MENKKEYELKAEELLKEITLSDKLDKKAINEVKRVFCKHLRTNNHKFNAYTFLGFVNGKLKRKD